LAKEHGGRVRNGQAEKRMASMTAYRRTLAGGFIAAICSLAASVGWAADDPRDAAFLAPLLQRVLETTRTDLETSWRNPATGNGGTIVVERTFYREPETPCRTYVRTLEARGTPPQVIKGTGCRDSTGLWVLEEEPERLADSGPRGTSPVRPGPAPGAGPEALAEAGPTCPDTVLVPMPIVRPPAFAYTMPSRAEF
jgi:surface antigen